MGILNVIKKHHKILSYPNVCIYCQAQAITDLKISFSFQSRSSQARMFLKLNNTYMHFIYSTVKTYKDYCAALKKAHKLILFDSVVSIPSKIFKFMQSYSSPRKKTSNTWFSILETPPNKNQCGIFASLAFHQNTLRLKTLITFVYFP